MPELPDITLYVDRLAERVVPEKLLKMRFFSPFVLRTFDPPASTFLGKRTLGVERVGKRVVFAMEDELFIVVHLMIAGRFTWSPELADVKPSKIDLAFWQWDSGTLRLSEASKKKRAGVFLVRGREGLHSLDRGGIDVLHSTAEQFDERLRAESKTLKRALTNPAAFDGIGNAYSDEILFAAKLSPMRVTRQLTPEESRRLYEAARAVLVDWIDRLRKMYPQFPKPAQITAFRPEFNVHGRYGYPCNVCGAPIQHIVHAENETNYCARCQNEGRLLADRSLSRLLKDDWPKTLDEMMGET